MATNPVGAFLAGFAAVDQLETNRLRRDFMEQQQEFEVERQSRVRKMWQRDDDEFERLKLERYRGEKLAQLDGMVRDIMNDPNTSAELLANPTAIFSEATKRMIAVDPDFGEHTALAVGLDPAAGAMVDNSNPVAGIVPGPDGGLAFELNTVNGRQPYTELRTSAANDPVAIRDVGMGELTRIFGPGVLQNDLLIAEQLRNLAGVQPTGAPTESIDKRRTAVEEAPPELSAAAKKNVALDEVVEGADAEERAARAAADAEREAAVAPAQEGAGEVGAGGAGAALVAGRATAAENIKKSASAFKDFVKGFQIIQLADSKPVEEEEIRAEPVKAVTEVPDRATYAPGTVAKSEAAAETAIAKAEVPGSEDAAAQIATRIATRPRKRPSLVDVYNAAGLARLGVITPKQLTTFARSGQFDDTAKANLQVVQSGNIMRLLDKNTGALSGPIKVDPSAEEGASDLEIFKDQRTMIENSFIDRDGKVDKGRVQHTLNQLETASDVLGLTDKQRVDRSNLISLTRGQQFVDRFSADTSQNLFKGTPDLNPFSDPELGPNNMVLGFVADQMGITNQEDADRFLFDYGITFRSAFPNMKAEDVVRNVIAMERRARGSNDLREEIVEATIAKAKSK